MLHGVDNPLDAYHLQQCAEKMLLALLTAENIHVERRYAHALDVLRSHLPDANPFKATFKPLETLSSFATTYRYPKDGGSMPEPPSAQEVAEWLEALERLIAEIAAHFQVDLKASGRVSALNVDPPR